MLIYPAIDLYAGEAVRLYQGDYEKRTVYAHDPVVIANDFKACGAARMHLVDLEGAKTGKTPHFETVCRIKNETGLFCEIGGGIRDGDTVSRYLDAGIDRVILGTAALNDNEFLCSAVSRYGEKIAVGVDIKDGFVAVKGWTETSDTEAFAFCRKMQDVGVRTLICTDISKDGAMHGTNRELYKQLSEQFTLDIIASGGVSSLDDVRALREMGLHGAIVGKAYYTRAIDLRKAIEVAK